MDVPTTKIADYIREMGIPLTVLSEKTGIQYYKLYNSLASKSAKRDLRAGEFLDLCKHLQVDPMRFEEG